MQVCDTGHDEIVFDNSAYNSKCPACKLLSEMGEQDDKIEELESTIADLREEVASLEGDN